MQERICPKCGEDATGGVLCVACNIPAVARKFKPQKKENQPRPLDNPLNIVMIIISIVIIIVMGLQLVNFLKDARVFGSKNKHHKNVKLSKDAQDAIGLVKSCQITFYSRGKALTYPAHYFLENFNPNDRTLATGIIELHAYDSPVDWNAEQLTQYLYKVIAINIDHDWVYEFQVSITTGEIKGLNENAQIVLNYKQY